MSALPNNSHQATYGALREASRTIHTDSMRLSEHLSRVEELLVSLRECWIDYRDFVWGMQELDPGGKAALSLVAATGRMNSTLAALEEAGMLPREEEDQA